jgi:hypothetical protein
MVNGCVHELMHSAGARPPFWKRCIVFCSIFLQATSRHGYYQCCQYAFLYWGYFFFTRNMISSILYHLSLRLSLSESGHMPSAPGTRGSAKNTRNILACISDNVENEIHNILACQHNQISMFASAFMLSFEKMNTPSILYISHPVLPISEKLPQLHHYMILQ